MSCIVLHCIALRHQLVLIACDDSGCMTSSSLLLVVVVAVLSHSFATLFLQASHNSQQWARRIADDTCTLGRIIGVVVEVWFYADGVCVSINCASHGVVFTARALER